MSTTELSEERAYAIARRANEAAYPVGHRSHWDNLSLAIRDAYIRIAHEMNRAFHTPKTSGPERWWVNQPSNLQPLHSRHGENVIVHRRWAPAAGGGHHLLIDAYTLSGDATSFSVPTMACLSPGWRPTADREQLVRALKGQVEELRSAIDAERAVSVSLSRKQPLTASELADALSCFWNAAIGHAHTLGSTSAMDTACVVSTGFAAVQARLSEFSQEPQS